MPRKINITEESYQKRSASEIIETQDSEKGYSLLEVLIALTLFVISILGLTMLQIKSIKGGAHANSLTIASAIATSRSEHFRQIDFMDPELSSGDHPAIQYYQFWVGWTVIDDLPLKPISEDSNGDPVLESVSKTVEIVVFSDSKGFSNLKGDNRLLTFSMIKTRHI